MIPPSEVRRALRSRWSDTSRSDAGGALSETIRHPESPSQNVGRHFAVARFASIRPSDAGFTLIELMVVLLILAILLAIAIPTFLGVTKSANDRAAQSNLNTAFQNSKAAFQQNSQAYPTSANLVTSLTSAEAALSFTTTNSASQSMIAVATSSDSKGVVLAAYSKAGNCWMIVDNTQTISQTTAPYGTSATASGSTTAGAIKLPTAPGTYYVELKGDNTTADCSASAPNLTSGTYQYATTGGFPS